jgi:hypothetical protein
MRIELVKVNETLMMLMTGEWAIHLYMALNVSISDRVFLAFLKIPLSSLCDQ